MASNCKGLHVSGERKGKLKKGYKWVKGDDCPVKGGGFGKAGKAARERVRRARSGGRITEFHCKGIVKTGKRRGKLKKGYKFKKGSACPVKAKRKR